MPTDHPDRHGYLMPTGDDKPAAVPMALAGYAREIEGQPVEYRRKEISRAGRTLQDVNGDAFHVTRQRLDKWVDNFGKMTAAGMKVPLPNKHFNFTADDTRGYVVAMERQGDSLYAVEQLIGQDAILAASRNDQSVFIDFNVKDDQGNVYDEAILHVAFTPTPQVTGMNGYAKVAASRGPAVDALILQATPQHRSFSMNAELSKKLREKLGVANDVADERLAELVGEKYLTADESLAQLARERDTAVAASRQQQPAPVAASMDPATLADKHEIATDKINLAVSKGDVPSAIAERLKDSLAGKDGKPAPVAMSRSDVTNGKEPWRYVLDLFDGTGLGPKADGKEKTGPQGAPVAASRPDPDGDKAKDKANEPANAVTQATQEFIAGKYPGATAVAAK